jgi:alpha-tubulin suppressor-like RCC1 family protein
VSGEHACALPGDGTVRCWGFNYYGELGDGTKTPSSVPPGDTLPLVTVTVITAAGSSTPLTGVTTIAAGLRHTCAVLTDSTVRCWGWNSTIHAPTGSPIAGSGGQVGDGTVIDRLAPVTVIASAGSTEPLTGAQALAAGWLHTCALMIDTTVKCWGTNTDGELGEGTTTDTPAPVAVIAAPGSTSPLSGVMAIAAGDFRTCALLADTTVTCWGWKGIFPPIDPNVAPKPDVTPVPVNDSPSGGVLSGVTAIAVAGGYTQNVGGFLACALMTSQRAKCWGANDYGELGDGTTTSSLSAVDVVGLSGPATAITGGCALLADTTISCWPSLDANGQHVNAPAPVVEAKGSTTPLTGVTTIAAADSQRCAILTGGSVKCWTRFGTAPTTVPGLVITTPAG